MFVGFFLVGHPTSVLLGFYFDLGMMGLTLGFIAGTFTMGLLYYLVLVTKVDWDLMAIQIRKKMLDDHYEDKQRITNDDLK